MAVLHCLNVDYQNSELMCFRNTHLKLSVKYFCLQPKMEIDFYYGSIADSPNLACSSQIFIHFFSKQ